MNKFTTFAIESQNTLPQKLLDFGKFEVHDSSWNKILCEIFGATG